MELPLYKTQLKNILFLGKLIQVCLLLLISSLPLRKFELKIITENKCEMIYIYIYKSQCITQNLKYVKIQSYMSE